MPIRVAEPNVEPSALQNVTEEYLIFFSSIVNGKLWCPDCVAVDTLVKDTFGDSGPNAVMVYVGNRSEWKTPGNAYRCAPWNIRSVPTIIKLRTENSNEERLVDDEISRKLQNFVKTS